MSVEKHAIQTAMHKTRELTELLQMPYGRVPISNQE